MAESFLFSIAEGIIKKLASAAVQEIGLAWGVKEELLKLDQTLSYIKAVLLDAELRQSKSHELKRWMDLVKDACYSINDVFDEFEVGALQKQVLGQSIGGKVSNFFSSSTNPLLFRLRMGGRIKDINARLDKIAADRDKFGLRELGDQNREIALREKGSGGTYSSLGKSNVIGRETEKDDIVNLLLAGSDKHDDLDVLPVVGIGGLGKTTLAKMAYNDERLTKHFQRKGWVCVSQDFNLPSVLKKIIKAVEGESCDGMDIDQLVAKVQQVLEGQRFFLVLDDLWNEDRVQWKELTDLLVGANGSKILVTTRNNKIADMVRTLPCQHLKGLPHKDSVSLFKSWAFKAREELSYPNLTIIGEEVVKKCKGVPLAIRTLGSLLYKKRDEREWLSVKDSDMWRIKQNDGGILPALRLSYDLLPSHLKQCFAHLSTYSKDSVIWSFDLIARWIALGFIESSNQNEELEEVGMKYINELFSRAFFDELTDLGTCSIMIMHDLMYDLALSVAENEYAVVGFHVKEVPTQARHLIVCDKKPLPIEAEPSCFLGLNNVRTVSVQNEKIAAPNRSFANLCISRFTFLRILVLAYSVLDELPHSMGDLKHLRYLNLSESKYLTLLPASLCKLVCLQTLFLGGCMQLKKLPQKFGNFVQLRCLTITTQEKCFQAEAFKCLASIRRIKIMGCDKLEHLFDDDNGNWMQESLINLHILIIWECPKLVSLPTGLRYLTALEKLTIYRCENLDLMMDMEDIIRDNGGMLQLTYLSVEGLPKLVSLPQWLIQGAANTLNFIVIVDCPNIATFPDNVISLQWVEIFNCPLLMSLPNGINSRRTLKQLHIFNCPTLIRRCQKDGEDWEKIHSVPEIYLDSNTNIQNPDGKGEKKWFESRVYLKAGGIEVDEDSNA